MLPFGMQVFEKFQNLQAEGRAKWYTEDRDDAAMEFCAHLDAVFEENLPKEVFVAVNDEEQHFTIYVQLSEFDCIRPLPDLRCILHEVTRFSVISQRDAFVLAFTV